ncbi:MAG: TolC family protein [Rhodospirillales bacterium]
MRSARLTLEAAEFTLQGVRQNVLFDGIDAYLEVLRQSRLVALGHESERTIMRQLHLEDERVQRGAGIAVDVLQAKSRLQVAKERRIGFEGGLADANTRYIEVFNHPPQPSRMVEPPAPTDCCRTRWSRRWRPPARRTRPSTPALPTSPSPNREEAGACRLLSEPGRGGGGKPAE